MARIISILARFGQNKLQNTWRRLAPSGSSKSRSRRGNKAEVFSEPRSASSRWRPPLLSSLCCAVGRPIIRVGIIGLPKPGSCWILLAVGKTPSVRRSWRHPACSKLN